MTLLIDAHVHIYPEYDTNALLHAFHTRIQASEASAGVMMLAEREGTDVFADWAAGRRLPDGYASVQSDETAIILRHDHAPDVIVIAGRQIACAERVEILALATRTTFRDGTPAHEVLEQTRAAGALPVLAWGVGKWLFSRAKVIDALLDASRDQRLFIADPSLRPVFWPTPLLMRKAISHGHRILAGSDPLSPKSEETRVGQYADLAHTTALDFNAPLTPQITSILTDHPLQPVGHRASLPEFIQRMIGR
ncbi:MAG: hypothetical protein GX748_02070 [Lentisphaerae bacterium]|nr:hypothetical protein [Lentisphaerota bacterium]